MLSGKDVTTARRWLLGPVIVLTLAFAPPNATALPCATGTLAGYISLGSAGCSVGEFTFSDFSFGVVSGTQTNPATAVATTNTIFINPPNSILDAMMITSNSFVVGSGDLVVYSFHYLLTAPEPILPGYDLAMVIDTPVAPGFALAMALAAPLVGLEVFHLGGAGSNQLIDEVTFAKPIDQIDVLIRLGLDASLGGSSTITGIGTKVPFLAVTPVPEPSTLLLLGSGLAGLGGIAWRRHRRG